MNNNTYTIILDFEGGTYINQVESFNETSALIHWLDNLDYSEITQLKPDVIENIFEDINQILEDEKPVELQDLKNVWCSTIIPNGLINIIKTNTQK